MPDDAINLTGLWRFQLDPYGEGDREGYATGDLDVTRWREVRLPAGFDRCGPGLDRYEGVGWFRRQLDIPASWTGRRIAMRFEAINFRGKIFLDGAQLGEESCDAFLPVERVVPDEYVGRQCTLVVRVDATPKTQDVPGKNHGWRPVGGILREASLNAGPWRRIAWHHVNSTPCGLTDQGRVRVCAEVANDRSTTAEIALLAELLDKDGAAITSFTSLPASLGKGKAARMKLDFHAAGVREWTPDDPALYTVRLTLLADGKPEQQIATRTGFRKFEVRGEQLLLNGKPIFLLGFNRHEDSPNTWMCPDPETTRRDLLDMKRMGANFVRLCHYPHHSGELDMCDEIGLLSMAEVPLYWWQGNRDGLEACASKLASARRQLAALIQRDRNHPSVAFWSVSNETQEQLPEVAAGNAELVNLARKLDPSRPAVHVAHGDRWRTEPHFEADDVICVNDYPAWNWTGPESAASAAVWGENLRKLHDAHPGRPIFVTEFGHPAMEGLYGNGMGQDVQADMLRAQFDQFTTPYVCGALIWCWADHLWPEENFVGCGLTTSPYGVVSRQRRKKHACATVREMFMLRSGRSTDPKPAPPAAGVSAAPPDPRRDRSVTMLRLDMKDIPQIEFPPGFGIRAMQPGEAALWTDVERDSEDVVRIGDDLFEMEFGADIESTQWRSFFVTNDKGAAIGVISAWYDRNFKGGDWGRIHWVATRRAFRGKGLAKAALSHAMSALAQWHSRAYLVTSTTRLPAIKMYLDFGFTPDLDQPGAADAWRQVKAGLQHPVLDKMTL